MQLNWLGDLYSFVAAAPYHVIDIDACAVFFAEIILPLFDYFLLVDINIFATHSTMPITGWFSKTNMM